MKARILEMGDRVRFTAQFLRNTGQYAGDDNPAHSGPWARGTVREVTGPVASNNRMLVLVGWDDGRETAVLSSNLEVIA